MHQSLSISIIVAASTNDAIGKDNQLLWHLPNDLKFFKKTTSGHTIIMGRKTFESVGRPLPNRRNIIITRQKTYTKEGIEIAHSLEEAIELAQTENKEIFIVGGADIYKQALPFINKLHLTRVHGTWDADSFFPKIEEKDWKLVSQENHTTDDKHAFDYTFEYYERIKS